MGISKSGVFWEKEFSANLLKLRSLVYTKLVHDISAKNFKNFFKWKKIQLQVSKSGVFWPKKISKTFLNGKNPTSSFKIGGILGEKIFRKHLETSVITSLQKGDSRYVGKKIQIFFK